MSKLLYVIAGNYRDYTLTSDHPRNNQTVRYCANATVLRGCKNIDFYVTEQGWQRNDINEILEQLFICNIGTEMEIKTEALRMERLLYA